LVRPFGLIGVALGTLIPLALSTAFVVFPAACRRVGVSLWRLVSHSILPAVWPAVVVGAVYGLVLPAPPERLSSIAFQAVLGGVLYLVLFAGVAIGRRDRAMYLSMACSIVRLERPLYISPVVPQRGM
jgi:hypothetical protein